MPTPEKPTAYRFSTGLVPDSKEEAAAGFIEDVMDPRFAQFDPDWSR